MLFFTHLGCVMVGAVIGVFVMAIFIAGKDDRK